MTATREVGEREKQQSGSYSRRFYETVSSSVADEIGNKCNRWSGSGTSWKYRGESRARIGTRDGDFKKARTEEPRVSSCAEHCVAPWNRGINKENACGR